MQVIKVLLCDDHIIVREGTRRLLQEEPDIVVVGEAGSGDEAVELARKLVPDVVAIDISMPGLSGTEAARIIRHVCPTARVLALSAYDDVAYVVRILECGGSGYVLKTAGSLELVAAIRAVAAGQVVLDPGIARQMVTRLARLNMSASSQPPVDPARVESLTQRELLVLRLLARGMSNKEIASALNLSPRTVQSHLASIFSKLGATSRTEAVAIALRKNLVDGNRAEEPSGGAGACG